MFVQRLNFTCSVTLCVTWLELVEIVKLDTACCNQTCRQLLLDLFQQNNVSFDGIYSLEHITDEAAMWTLCRKVKLASIPFDTSKPCSVVLH